MAASSTKLYADLVIVVRTGTDELGKAILKKSTVGKVLSTAADQDVYDVVKGIEAVLMNPVSSIEKIDHNVIVNG